MSMAMAGITNKADLNSDADKLRSALHEVFTKIDEEYGRKSALDFLLCSDGLRRRCVPNCRRPARSHAGLLPVCACSKGGTHDKDELGHVFEAINNPLSKQELEDVMNDIDESGDGDVRLARAPRAAPAGWTN